MKKRLLILNGSLSEITLIQAAKKLGYYVITSGNRPDFIGHSYADEYIGADYSDKDAILKIVQDNNINAIVSSANDFGAITASYVSDYMNWKGHDSYENSVLLHQKDLLKDFFKKNNIPSPPSEHFSDKESAIQFVKTVKYPIMIKSVDLTGGKGVRKVENLNEALDAINNSFERSRANRIVIEPFIDGTQHAMTFFIADKKVIACVGCNSYSPKENPYLIQTEIFPSDNFETVKVKLIQIVEKISNILNLADGILTFQYFLSGDNIYIIELMRRCLGNQYLTCASYVSGFPWEEALVRAETGMKYDDMVIGKPKAKYCGFHGITADRNGIIKSFGMNPELRPYIFKFITWIHPGERVLDCLTERLAYAYYAFEDRDEMIKTAKHMNDYFYIQYE